MDKDKMIRLFLEEQRQQELSPSEIAAIAQSLLKEERAAAEARRRANLKKGTAPPEGERFNRFRFLSSVSGGISQPHTGCCAGSSSCRPSHSSA